MKVFVWATHQFEGLHHYDDAQSPVHFLRNPHRHLFKMKAWVEVKHDNREVEFLSLKQNLKKWFIDDLKTSWQWSCESIAENCLNHLKTTYGEDRSYRVEVSEDGENGAIVET